VGAADAGIVWDVTASQYEQLEMVNVPEFETKQNRTAIGILRSTKDATRALHFARYVTARDRGLRNFQRHGYRVASGDVWAERPEISLFSGGLNWVATEEIVKAFQQREGCTVLTKAKGCGSLVGEMKLAMGRQAEGSPTDVYFACDVEYMAQVQQWFGDSENVSKADMVIAVPEGNPQNIRTMDDLAQEGLAVGMCDAELSALGHLTKKLLDAHGLYEKVLANTKDRPGTAAVLVERVALGNLDAAIVYLPNQVKEGENVSVIPIDDPLAFAIQPIAVGNGSDHAQLAGRLMDRILSTESRSIFEKYEFTWLAGQTDETEIPDGERGPDGESTAAP
jgi:ABC-type molybdate transport system substrate-binding protein